MNKIHVQIFRSGEEKVRDGERNKIEAIRLAILAGYSYREMAAALGLSAQAISQYYKHHSKKYAA